MIVIPPSSPRRLLSQFLGRPSCRGSLPPSLLYRVSLGSPRALFSSCPWDPPASAAWALGPQVCATTLSFVLFISSVQFNYLSLLGDSRADGESLHILHWTFSQEPFWVRMRFLRIVFYPFYYSHRGRLPLPSVRLLYLMSLYLVKILLLWNTACLKSLHLYMFGNLNSFFKKYHCEGYSLCKLKLWEWCYPKMCLFYDNILISRTSSCVCVCVLYYPSLKVLFWE